jgi:cytidylate kinase
MIDNKLVIAIDGPAASGKSTTAKLVAEHFGYIYIDTGAMYRAVTLAVLRQGVDPADRPSVEALAGRIGIELRRRDDGGLGVLLDREDVSHLIRTPEVTSSVSLVSSYPEVRRRLVELQKSMGRNGGVVLDGRDIGTVVFPDADVKVFMVADLQERAVRRREEMQKMGSDPGASVDGLMEDLASRDRFDSTRELSPLARATDAVDLDTSGLSIAQQVARVIALAEQKLQR